MHYTIVLDFVGDDVIVIVIAVAVAGVVTMAFYADNG